MMMEKDVQPGTELLPLNAIRVETALSRWPVHRLARKGNIDISIRELAKGGDGERWEVDYSKKHGQPGPLAYKIDTLIINRRIEEARRPIPRVLKLGSLSDICRELGMADSGKNREHIKNSLFQNAFAGITVKTRYRDSDGNEHPLEAAFNRYSVILRGEKLPDGRKADSVYVVLNDVFIRVINGAMTRPLDYDYLKSLPPAPQRFYEVLSYQIYAALKYDRPRAKLVYSEFCAHAPQTRHTEWERVRSQMTKIHRPHRQSGYIAKVDFQQTTASDGQPDWIMFYQPGPTARAEFRAFTKRGGPSVLEIESSEVIPGDVGAGLPEIEQELVNRGVSEDAAKLLVRDHAEEKILQQMEILDWRLEGKKAEKIDDPAAWLVSAIKSPTGHAAPKGFVSKAERQRREEARLTKERQAAAKRRQEQEQDARERDTRLKVDAYLKQLDQAGRLALEAEALAAASPKDRENYDSHIMARFREMLMLVMIRQYLAGNPELEQIAVEA
jgi:hypothetical protein